MNRSSPDGGGEATPERATPPPAEPGTEPVRRQIYGIGTTVVRFRNAEYYVPDYARHRPVSKKVLHKRKVSPALDRFVGRVMERHPGSMVHAGTFFGDMLPSFSRKTPGVVYAFEPVIENYLLARAVVQTNNLTNVLLMHCALGATRGVATVGVARGRRKRHCGGAAHILGPGSKPHSQTQLTSVLTIDQLGMENLALIQLDTEGYELPILQGAAGTIRAYSPVIVVEDNKDECAEFLTERGYVDVGRLGRDTVYSASASANGVIELVVGARHRARPRSVGHSRTGADKDPPRPGTPEGCDVRGDRSRFPRSPVVGSAPPSGCMN